MRKLYKIFPYLLFIAVGIIFVIANKRFPKMEARQEILVEQKDESKQKENIPETELQHRREVWLSALEWCESRGVKTAINKMDKDGTPSYFSYQFKPSTFKYYSIKYGMLPADIEYEDYFNQMSDYDIAREVVRRMIDDPKVVWSQEFPDCVRKLGLPPIK